MPPATGKNAQAVPPCATTPPGIAYTPGHFAIAFRKQFRCLEDMPFRTRAPFLVLTGICLLALPAAGHSPAQEMSATANNFTASLTPQQRAKAVFEFKDDERFDWHFIPKPRKGLPFGEMTTP